MKLRRGFVTNSSSSSFVIAVRDGMSKEDIRKELEQMIPEEKLDNFCKDWEESKESVLDEMVYILKTRSDYGMKLNGFNVGADYWEDYDCELGAGAVQTFNLNSDNIKVERCD